MTDIQDLEELLSSLRVYVCTSRNLIGSLKEYLYPSQGKGKQKCTCVHCRKAAKKTQSMSAHQDVSSKPSLPLQGTCICSACVCGASVKQSDSRGALGESTSRDEFGEILKLKECVSEAKKNIIGLASMLEQMDSSHKKAQTKPSEEEVLYMRCPQPDAASSHEICCNCGATIGNENISILQAVPFDECNHDQ